MLNPRLKRDGLEHIGLSKAQSIGTYNKLYEEYQM